MSKKVIVVELVMAVKQAIDVMAIVQVTVTIQIVVVLVVVEHCGPR